MKKARQVDLEEAIAARGEAVVVAPSAQSVYLDARGRELPDPTPIAPPLGYKRSPSLADQIRTMVRSEKLRMEAEAAGAETFEEADDFDVGDFEPGSPYEEEFDPTPVQELRRRAAADAEEKLSPTPPPPVPEPVAQAVEEGGEAKAAASPKKAAPPPLPPARRR